MKHVGRIKNTGDKIIVAFRTVPGESDKALIVHTATLPDSYHDSLMKLVESDQGQDAFEFGEIMFTRTFPDGRPMLLTMQQSGRLQKISTDRIMMTPTPASEISLDQLNVAIAEQKNCTIDELCTFVSGGPKTIDSASSKEVEEPAKEESQSVLAQAGENEVLSDKDIAKSYRSQADALYKEAARLRKQADELDPPQKKVLKAKETVDA